MVCAPVPMSKWMVSAPAVAFAARIASRSEMALSAPGLASRAAMLVVVPSATSALVVTSKTVGDADTIAGAGIVGRAGAPAGAEVRKDDVLALPVAPLFPPAPGPDADPQKLLVAL